MNSHSLSQAPLDPHDKGGSLMAKPGPPSVAGSMSSKVAVEPEPIQPKVQDRLVRYLVTLVTYPYIYLLLAHTAEQQGAPAAAAGLLENRHHLTDFAESRALINFERWCRKPAYTSLVIELVHKYVLLWRAVVLNTTNNAWSRSWLLDSFVMRRFHIPPDDPIQIQVHDHLLRAEGLLQLLGPGAPEHALAELQADVAPNVLYMKKSLEERFTLSRNRTMLERMEMVLSIVRIWVRAWFKWLRAVARALNYFSSLLGIVSGAVSFTVIPSIILSVLSAGIAIFALVLTTAADFGEPVMLGALQWTETGTAQVHRVSEQQFGYGDIVQPRRLRPATVEELEPFFESQVQQHSAILHRPEVPHLARDPLLLKCYDLGIIDASGDVSDAAVWALLAKSPTGPFRKDGFFRYCSRLQIRAATILLVRLLAWRRISAAVRGDEAIRFVMLMGQRQANKGALFARLVSYPQDYSKALAKSPQLPAVDIRPILGEKATYAVVFPGLDSDDIVIEHLAKDLGTVLSGMCACMVFMARPDSDPQPEDLELLGAALRARRSCLVCIDRSLVSPAKAPKEQAARGQSAAAPAEVGIGQAMGQGPDTGSVGGGPRGFEAQAEVSTAPVGSSGGVAGAVDPGTAAGGSGSGVGSASGVPAAPPIGEAVAPVVMEVQRVVLDEAAGVLAVEVSDVLIMPGERAAATQAAPTMETTTQKRLSAGSSPGVGGNSPGGGGSGTQGGTYGGNALERPGGIEALRGRWLAVLESRCQELGIEGGPSHFAVMVTDITTETADVAPGVHQFQQVREWVLTTAREYERAV